MNDGIDAFFDPERVAVIGASTDTDKIGHTIFRNFVESTFSGELIPINPNADTVMDHTSYDTVRDVPGSVDLAVVAVPATISNDVIRDCVDAEVDAVIVITSGYSELGEEGEERAAELDEILASGETRLLGPNCLGVWDGFSGVDTLFLPSYKLKRPPQGSIAIVTQSGSFGSTVMDMLAERGIGVSRFISYGNQADVTEAELLEWLEADEYTAAVAVYMEGVSGGNAFMEAARQVTHSMPVIALKGGRRGAARDAVSSHTGSLAGSYDVYRGVFRQTRVLEADTIADLFDYARALAYNRPMPGDQVAVVTNGGGFGVLTADSLEARGLSLAGFTEETRDALRDIIPSYGGIGNPLDVIGDADVDRFIAALEYVGADPNVDGIVAIPLLQPVHMGTDVVDELAGFQDDVDVPVVACLTGSEYTRLQMRTLERNGVAAMETPDRAAAAMQSLYQYGQWHD